MVNAFQVVLCITVPATQTKAIRIFQHIYLMYANGLGEINEGTINHYNDA